MTDPRLKAGAAAAVLAIVGAVAYGLLSPDVAPGKRRVQVAFDGPAPAGTRCLWVTALANPEAQGLFGLDSDAGPRYLRVRTCAPPSDNAKPSLPAGLTVLDADQTEEDYTGGPRLLGALSGEPEFACACSTGSDCEADMGEGYAAAPMRTTLGAGTWRGAGCYRKPCVEGRGLPSSWPTSECGAE